MHLWRPSLSVLALALHGVMHCSPVKESLVYITLDFIAVVSYSTLLAWAFWANVTVVRACVCVCGPTLPRLLSNGMRAHANANKHGMKRRRNHSTASVYVRLLPLLIVCGSSTAFLSPSCCFHNPPLALTRLHAEHQPCGTHAVRRSKARRLGVQTE
jgi:hypothetical protein